MSTESRSPAQRLASILAERGQTLAVAEGATGGLLAHLLTQVPGSSGWLRAGIVAYTDFSKQLILRVAAETIEEQGSIGPEATVQMARLARRLFGTDWGLAVTGYADSSAPAEGPRARGVPDRNPEGAVRVEAEKREPSAGLTFIAVSGPGSGRQPDTHSWEEWQLDAPDRETYKRNAAETAIETLLKIIEG
jgi:PncC family amidohydrolase